MCKIMLCDTPVNLYTLRCGQTKAEIYASELLGKYLEKIGGEPLLGGEGTIELFIDEKIEGADAYRITNAKRLLSISGSNARGLIYGVYAFLEKHLGVRCFMPGLERLGEGGNVPELCEEFRPIFEFRQSDWICGRDPDWCAANRLNNYSFMDEKRGGYVKWGSFVHTMSAITGCLPNEQPCLSDPKVLEQAIAYVRGILERDPTVNLISVSQNDNQNYCQCPKCAAVDEEEGSHMGSLLRLVNAVAENIKDDYPNVAIETLAYQYTRQAPKITKPLPNVVIRLCSIECCFSHPLSDETCTLNKAFKNDIEEWGKICDRLYIWDYVTNFAYYVPTFPNFGVLRENMRFYALHGVRGMYPEGNFQAESGEFGELRAYLLAKLMWDPLMSEKEYQKYMDEFLEAYYGEGWRYIRAYIDLMVNCVRREHMRIYDFPFKFISPETYESLYDTFEDWWDKAEALAGDRLDHVKRSRLQWTYLSLCVRPNKEKASAFFEEVNARKIRWRETMNRLPDEEEFSLPPFRWKFKN